MYKGRNKGTDVERRRELIKWEGKGGWKGRKEGNNGGNESEEEMGKGKLKGR